jgi:hypothetical protein
MTISLSLFSMKLLTPMNSNIFPLQVSLSPIIIAGDSMIIEEDEDDEEEEDDM